MFSSMAETDSDNIKYQKLVSEQNQVNPSKFYSQFMYKALIVIVFLVIIPLFPSQAPEFINQSVLTRSWELLHLVVVGIAVSYGLFSRRNDETEKENNNSKFDNAHSYVSRFLEVSSVFDDEAESPSGSDENKVQTWSSQYYRNEPVVVVAQEHSVLDEQRIISGEKPLLLPVRSLKSRVPDAGVEKSANESESIGSSVSNSRSNSKQSSKRFSSNSIKSRNVELGGLDHVELEEKLMDNVVLPSPIPWRTRSGRFEMKEEVDSPPLYTLPPPMEESDFNRVESRASRSQISHSSSRSNSNTSSPKLSLSSPRKSSPSPSAESQAKNAEDFVRKKSYKSSTPPTPPPPPPPPPMIRTSASMKQNSSNGVSFEKDLRRSFTTERKELNRVNGSAMGKSVRKLRPSEAAAKPTFVEFSEEEREDFVDTVAMVSDEDTETEDDDNGGDFVPTNFGRSFKKEEAASSSVSDGGPDVDKKADEFIAKFREQIRLQRIESIKRSTGHIKRNSSR